MKKTRVIILGFALVAAGSAAWLAAGLSSNSTADTVVGEINTIIERVPTIRILVAKESIPVGSRLNDEIVEWKNWPEDALVEGYFNEEISPDAIDEMAGIIVRLPIFKGEPIRSEKIVSSSTRIMSSLLPAGKRAVATEISVATGAGGFILPNDRVDVIMVRRADQGGGYLTENILENIRILAIDQRIDEDAEGNRTAVGTTATLELTPEQSQIIAVGQQMADRITLALRSVADVDSEDTGGAAHLVNTGSGGNEIQVIRSGKLSQAEQIQE
tara:strand:- start:4269 stop:5084 length:816 start_codon:yes stop_codon:yes gene_type:complete